MLFGRVRLRGLSLPQQLLGLLLALLPCSFSLNVVIPGGTGALGQLLSSSLSEQGHDVTILCRNSFLASTPTRVSNDFGWMGKSFLNKYPDIRLRDWDGGDLLDIVGKDWVGWADDTLKNADVVVNLVGGYTQQREMAAERIIRESLRVNPAALQIAVSPKEEELKTFSPGLFQVKKDRLEKCENMVKDNCQRAVCLRLEAYKLKGACAEIERAIQAAM